MLLLSPALFAQRTVVSGKVTEAASGDPIPFANIIFTGTEIGTTTNFEGLYTLETTHSVDSLTVSFVGYISKTKPLTPGIRQVIDFQIDERVFNLNEVVVRPGENPAFPILRKIIKNKSRNDKKSLEAYQYETYTKVELDIDNISEKFREKKMMQKVTRVMDSVERIAGEDGKPIMPFFISETISAYYFRNNPKLQHEKILKTKMTGIGIEDGSLISQFTGSSFQEYNFYQNWLNIVEKEFISPIADGWRLYYDYDLIDSVYVGETYCYQLDFFPRSKQDLAFTGTMWITADGFALKQINANITKDANVNYIEKIRIQQELEPTEAGPWIPVKNRVLIDIGEINDNMAGMLAKFYTSNKNILVNEPQNPQLYLRPIELAEDYKLNSDDAYWRDHRHEPLNDTELSVYKMIDTLRNIPVVRTYTDIFKVLFNGYKKAGMIDIGPYLSLYANNNIEGNRFQPGFKTNITFSDKWVLGGWLAYGTKDEAFKYKIFGERILSRPSWTVLRAEYSKDIDQIGLSADELANNYIFLTASRFGTLIKPYWYEQAKLSFGSDLFTGFRSTVIFNHKTFNPLYNFAYYTTDDIATHVNTSEITLEARYAKDELFVQNDNERISLGTLKSPIFTVRYTKGLTGVLGSDFTYDKLGVNIVKDIKMGFFGTSTLTLTGEHIFDPLPYPLLKAHIGNESAFYTTVAFNTMNYSEFLSDSYLELRYLHHFQGFILNRVPLMKKLKWRLIASANAVYGTLSDANRQLVADTDEEGNPIAIGFFDDGPYLEVGYGVENVFKILWIEFFHRLTYLDNPDANKFGVKVSVQFVL